MRLLLDPHCCLDRHDANNIDDGETEFWNKVGAARVHGEPNIGVGVFSQQSFSQMFVADKFEANICPLQLLFILSISVFPSTE